MSQNILKYFDLAQYFDIICGAVSDHNRSTKEAVIEHLLSQLESKNDLVMVGDTIYDVKGAAYHGIPCVAVTWGYGVVEEMRAAGAKIVSTMEELYDNLK